MYPKIKIEKKSKRQVKFRNCNSDLHGYLCSRNQDRNMCKIDGLFVA